nr:hypothetical protein [Sinorhizobium medicae]MBO1944604.1 hypothetical protein [Sinorhizobium medicae]
MGIIEFAPIHHEVAKNVRMHRRLVYLASLCRRDRIEEFEERSSERHLIVASEVGKRHPIRQRQILRTGKIAREWFAYPLPKKAYYQMAVRITGTIDVFLPGFMRIPNNVRVLPVIKIEFFSARKGRI